MRTYTHDDEMSNRLYSDNAIQVKLAYLDRAARLRARNQRQQPQGIVPARPRMAQQLNLLKAMQAISPWAEEQRVADFIRIFKGQLANLEAVSPDGNWTPAKRLLRLKLATSLYHDESELELQAMMAGPPPPGADGAANEWTLKHGIDKLLEHNGDVGVSGCLETYNNVTFKTTNEDGKNLIDPAATYKRQLARARTALADRGHIVSDKTHWFNYYSKLPESYKRTLKSNGNHEELTFDKLHKRVREMTAANPSSSIKSFALPALGDTNDSESKEQSKREATSTSSTDPPAKRQKHDKLTSSAHDDLVSVLSLQHKQITDINNSIRSVHESLLQSQTETIATIPSASAQTDNVILSAVQDSQSATSAEMKSVANTSKTDLVAALSNQRQSINCDLSDANQTLQERIEALNRRTTAAEF